jgi:hypothetical protein
MKRTFFISRAGVDRRWAELIARVVKDAGHEPIYQDEHFRVGQSFIDNMARAAEADCTIAILSPDYFNSEYCLSELNAALSKDPLGRRGRVIPVRVKPVEMPSVLGHITYLDLVGADDDTARQRLMTTLLKHGQVDVTRLSLFGRTRRVVEQANRNRSAMIEKVRTIWITGFLQQSLFNEVRILLSLSERPDAVARPLDLLVKRPDEGERPLPSGTQVVDAFDTMDQALLILGAPGSGKTALLLELARDLLDRAEQDRVHPIPVVFPLSTWAESRKSLVEWLQDELNLRYDIPRKIAQEWVATDQILPLLDGLDEIKAEHRAACVEAINAFRQSHGLLPLVITSRTADYEAIAKPLRLHGAILVSPLTHEQVGAYLTNLGPAGEPVRAAIREDVSLWELLDSPLLLNIVTVTYAGKTEAPTLGSGTMAERRDHLFGSYVNQMLQRRAAQRRYTADQTVRWLSWLADQMAKQGQTVFYLERLQRDWLPRKQQWAILVSTVLISGLVCTLVNGLVVGLVWVPLIGLVDRRAMVYAEWVQLLASWLVPGLVVGLVAGLAVAGPPRWCALSKEIVCVETVRWAWSHCWRSGSNWLLFAPVVALYAGVSRGLAVGLLVGLCYGVISLGFGLVGGLTFSQVEARAVPNEGIRRSARNALFVALVVGLFVILFVGLAFGLVFGLFEGVVLATSADMFIWQFVRLIGGLRAGGVAFLKHVALRLLLVSNGSTPWNYVRFLDHATERLLLRKVGGGYAFIHRMLLDHFAARYVEPSLEITSAIKPSRIGMEV